MNNNLIKSCTICFIGLIFQAAGISEAVARENEHRYDRNNSEEKCQSAKLKAVGNYYKCLVTSDNT